MNQETKFFNAFNMTGVLGPAGFKKLIDHFPSLKYAWTANVSELQMAGFSEKIAQKIGEQRRAINPDKEMEKLAKENVTVLTLSDEKYPARLKQISDPPGLLYVKGTITPQDELALAVVGSRKYSTYGKETALKFAANLASCGITVVSGMALGIDAFAHQAALRAGGRTLAVLGSGLAQSAVYPVSNHALARKICDRGALISEFPLETKARPEYFPMRNRIISGMSLGVLVIEAREKSGALITANQALDQNREVFAVPGSIFSASSAGTNELIKQGAKAVTCVDDILEELGLAHRRPNDINAPNAREIQFTNNEEKIVFNLIAQASDPIHIDKIIILSNLHASAVGSCLSLLELKGLIKNVGGGNYISCNLKHET